MQHGFALVDDVNNKRRLQVGLSACEHTAVEKGTPPTLRRDIRGDLNVAA